MATQAAIFGVKLGRELVRLGSAVHSNLRFLLRPLLQDLHFNRRGTVDLAFLMHGMPIIVVQITSTASLPVACFVGRPFLTPGPRAGYLRDLAANITAGSDNDAIAGSMPPGQFQLRLPVLREALQKCQMRTKALADGG